MNKKQESIPTYSDRRDVFAIIYGDRQYKFFYDIKEAKRWQIDNIYIPIQDTLGEDHKYYPESYDWKDLPITVYNTTAWRFQIFDKNNKEIPTNIFKNISGLDIRKYKKSDFDKNGNISVPIRANERLMRFPTELEKDEYIKDNNLEVDKDYKDKGINMIELCEDSCTQVTDMAPGSIVGVFGNDKGNKLDKEIKLDTEPSDSQIEGVKQLKEEYSGPYFYECDKCGFRGNESDFKSSELIIDNHSHIACPVCERLLDIIDDRRRGYIEPNEVEQQLYDAGVLNESKLQETEEDDIEEDDEIKSLYDYLVDLEKYDEIDPGHLNTTLQSLFGKYNEIFILTSDIYNQDPSERQELSIFDDDDLYILTYEIVDQIKPTIRIVDVTLE